MKNKPNFFFDNRGFPIWGGGWGGSAAWEFFPHNPVFFSDNVPKSHYGTLKISTSLFCCKIHIVYNAHIVQSRLQIIILSQDVKLLQLQGKGRV